MRNPWFIPMWIFIALMAITNIGMWATISSPLWPAFTGAFGVFALLWLVTAVGAWRHDR